MLLRGLKLYAFDSKDFFSIIKDIQSLETRITDVEVNGFLSGCFYFGKGQADRPNVQCMRLWMKLIALKSM